MTWVERCLRKPNCHAHWRRLVVRCSLMFAAMVSNTTNCRQLSVKCSRLQWGSWQFQHVLRGHRRQVWRGQIWIGNSNLTGKRTGKKISSVKIIMSRDPNQGYWEVELLRMSTYLSLTRFRHCLQPNYQFLFSLCWLLLYSPTLDIGHMQSNLPVHSLILLCWILFIS